MENVETQPLKMQKYGTREQVYNGLAQQTKGKLKKEDLVLCEKTGKYKSVKAVERGKNLIQNIRKPAQVEAPTPEPEPVPEPVLEKPKRTRKKKVVEAAA